MICSCDDCERNRKAAIAQSNQKRDELANSAMHILLASDTWQPQKGSGGGGLECMAEELAYAAYTIADAMILQSQKKTNADRRQITRQ